MRYISLLLLCTLFVFSPLLAQDSNQLNFPTFADLQLYMVQIMAADAANGQALVEDLWSSLTASAQIPFVRGNEIAFFYRGLAEQVEWVGDLNQWQRNEEMTFTRMGQTDLWMLTTQAMINARIEYRLIVDNNQEQILDPANAHRASNGFQWCSEVQMPLYTSTRVTDRRAGVPQGSISTLQLIDSVQLGYTLGYWVYTPVGYETLDNLPVLYLLDGEDFVDEQVGAFVTALDNMIADERIVPIITVFLSATDPLDETLRREEQFLQNPAYGRFIVEELIPDIDAQYRVNPEARALAGVSLGGASAAAIAVAHADTFAMIGLFSPGFWAAPELTQLYLDAPMLPARYFISMGWPQWDNVLSQPALDLLAAKSVDVLFLSTVEGHSFGTWSGLYDEMLTFFFGIPVTE